MDLHAATEVLQSALAVIAAARLVYFDLAKKFPALLAYLIFIAISSCAAGVVDQRSSLYFWVYVSYAPAQCIFSVLAARELFTLTFDNYPGIRTVGRWTMYAGIGLAASVSLALTKVFWNTGANGGNSWGVFYLEVAQRSVVFSLAVAIIAIAFVLSRYPLHLDRNTYVSAAFFSALFVSDAVRLFIDGLAQGLYNNYADWGEAILIALFLTGWAALLRPQTAPAARIAFSTPEEDHLLRQLNSLNQLMSRAARQ